MGVVNIYIFDARTGDMVGAVVANAANISSGSVEAELSTGEYTFVAWGTSAGSLEQGSYRVSGGTIDDFTLELKNSASFAELYHAVARNVVIVQNGNATVPLNFIRHTNLLRVRVSDHMPSRAESSLDVYVTGRKGLYAHDGTIHPDAVRHTYPSSDGDDMEFEVRLLRLEKDFHSDNPVLLHVEHGGEPLFEPQDIVRLLMEAGYRSQDDFDKAHIHTIELEVDAPTGGVTITINGYTIVIAAVEL